MRKAHIPETKSDQDQVKVTHPAAIVNRTIAIELLDPHPRNYNGHPPGQIEELRNSIRIFGQVRSIVVWPREDKAGRFWIIAGHGTVTAARLEGLTALRADVIPATWPEIRALAYLAADNETSRGSDPDRAQLEALVADVAVRAGEETARAAAGAADQLAKIRAKLAAKANPSATAEALSDRAAELQRQWATVPGQLWQVGRHRVLIGDCTDQAVVDRVLGGKRAKRPALLLTDPPYCSGGFQEAGRKSGSIGTRGDEMIANDTLSTRGYIALMRRAFATWAPGLMYCFTDWRMWVTLFDVAESSGYGVRNMIVWDKGSPGLGVGWRAQHELILTAMQVSHPFDPKKAQGNVIHCDRTGNANHPTEKPIKLIATLLDVADMAHTVADGFIGSGPSLLACEQLGRTCFGTDKDPKWIAVLLQRWLDATGERPRMIDD